MKKTMALVVIFLLMSVCNVYASTFLDARAEIDVSDQTADIFVASTDVVYTQSRRLNSGVYYGVSYLANSQWSTPDVTIELEQSYKEPTTEGASDVTYTTAVGSTAIATNLTDETWQHESLSPVPTKYMRYKITGNAGNATDTQVYIYTNTQSFQ